MKKPTVIELREYATEIGFNLDVQAFIDHYQSNGWMVGKTKMKDWKATVRTWKRMAPQFKKEERRPFVPINKRNERINQLNKRKAELMRMPDTPRVRQELEVIRIELLKL